MPDGGREIFFIYVVRVHPDMIQFLIPSRTKNATWT